ncbi:hypothetical protein EJ05DRAFT_542662 [Pseudovirgaria hyperparasitica]|uniref:Uncharacterized protein n=1 Tax=Pseudovirgaria hyperparasitica TaxID=470096 RepID=A0A6A6VP11_9PEZI|nr:uncharacterized protein EJ05DRAFT_542662 [Pseudovirgaria hyperparasitica]KAF2752368.1 hypothetical protein EJ05DRAFT_542662 [Pseudovirgaria hyperparasitica]
MSRTRRQGERAWCLEDVGEGRGVLGWMGFLAHAWEEYDGLGRKCFLAGAVWERNARACSCVFPDMGEEDDAREERDTQGHITKNLRENVCVARATCQELRLKSYGRMDHPLGYRQGRNVCSVLSTLPHYGYFWYQEEKWAGPQPAQCIYVCYHYETRTILRATDIERIISEIDSCRERGAGRGKHELGAADPHVSTLAATAENGLEFLGVNPLDLAGYE